MTTQICDILVWQGEVYNLESSYLTLKKVYPEINFPKFDFFSTACSRGYIATWVIDENGFLNLVQIGTGVKNELLSDGSEQVTYGALDQLTAIFPNQDNGVPAISFTGDITVGYGDDIQRHGYFRSYPNYKVFSILHGRLTDIGEHDRSWWLADKRHLFASAN